MVPRRRLFKVYDGGRHFERRMRVVWDIGVSREDGRPVSDLRLESSGRDVTAWRIVGVVVRRTILS